MTKLFICLICIFIFGISDSNAQLSVKTLEKQRMEAERNNRYRRENPTVVHGKNSPVLYRRTSSFVKNPNCPYSDDGLVGDNVDNRKFETTTRTVSGFKYNDEAKKNRNRRERRDRRNRRR